MFFVTALNSAAAALDIPGLNWKYIFYAGFLSNALFESWLDLRQVNTLTTTTYANLPPTIAGLVDKETYDKSREYSKTKLRFGLITRAIGVALKVGLYSTNFLPAGWSYAQHVISQYSPWGKSSTVLQSAVLWELFSIIDVIVETPLEWYRTFFIEEKFGFNKTTPKTFVLDIIKSFFVSTLFGLPLLAAVVAIIDHFGRAFIGYVCVFAIVVSIAASVVYPSVIAPLFNKFTPLEDKKLYAAIEQLASKLHFPMEKIYVIDGSKRSSHSNAYFTGLPLLPKRIVLFDSLLETHSTSEILAVMAHEMGHWARNHIPMLMALNQVNIISLSMIIAVLLGNKSLATSLQFKGSAPTIVSLMVFSDVAGPLLCVIQLMVKHFCRYCEYDADRFAVDHGYGSDLSTGLILLSKKNLSVYIADKLYSAYNYTHPILHERLSAIKEEENVVNRKSK